MSNTPIIAPIIVPSSTYDELFESLWKSFSTKSIRVEFLTKNPELTNSQCKLCSTEWNISNVKEYLKKELLAITCSNDIINAFYKYFIENKDKYSSFEMEEIIKSMIRYISNKKFANICKRYRVILDELVKHYKYYDDEDYDDEVNDDWTELNDDILYYLVKILFMQTVERYNKLIELKSSCDL